MDYLSEDNGETLQTKPSIQVPIRQTEKFLHSVHRQQKKMWMLLWRQRGKLPEWKTQTKEARALILEKIADRIEENKEWLAQVETMDNGKPIRETSTIDIPYSIRHFRYYASLIRTDEEPPLF